VKIFNKILSASQNITLEKITSHHFYNRFFLKEAPLPFEEFFVPFILTAREELMGKAGISYYSVGPKIHAVLERHILGILNYLCVKSIYEKFLKYKKDKGLSLYKNFMKNLLTGEFIDFFNTYPLLARLMSDYIINWSGAISTFLIRLEEDLPEISEIFLAGNEVGKICTIIPGLSDHHNKGQTVIFIAFSSGLRLIYKPRSLSPEEAYFKMLSWLNINGGPHKFKILKILGREGYGWMEFADCLPCKNEEEVKNYYRNGGVLLCLLYLLGVSDCHFENIIASGKYPVLIDVETIMMPEIKFSKDRKENSVLRTGLLPHPYMVEQNKAIDVSGFAGPFGKDISFEKEVWTNLKTDNITPEKKREQLKAGFNIPLFEGKKMFPFDYKDYIIEGFKDFYLYLMINKERLLAPESPLIFFKGQKVRFFLRHSAFYLSLLEKILVPSLFKDGLLWSLELEKLTEDIFETEMVTHKLWPGVKEEIYSIQELNIPSFFTSSDSNAFIWPGGEKIENFFYESGYELVLQTLKKMSPEDMEKQIEFIGNSFISL